MSETRTQPEIDEDHRAIGAALLDVLHSAYPSYSWTNCPTEVVCDLLDDIQELEREHAGALLRLQSELAALRRPVVLSEQIERIRAKYARDMATIGDDSGIDWELNCWQDVANIRDLLSALDQAQRDLDAMKSCYASIYPAANEYLNRALKAEAEVARLSSPPEERGEMKMPALMTASFHQGEWCLMTAAGDVVELVEDDEYCGYAESKAMRDTLLQDAARYRNAHCILMLERDEARGKVEELQKDVDHKAKWGQQFVDLWTAREKRIEQLQSALTAVPQDALDGGWNVADFAKSLRAEVSKPLVERIEQLEAALRLTLPMAKGWAHEHPVGDNQGKVDHAAEVLAAADGRQKVGPNGECPICGAVPCKPECQHPEGVP